MSVNVMDKKELKDSHKDLLSTAAGMNQALLDLSPNEHATILKTLGSLYEFRVSQEQAEAARLQQSERVNKVLYV